MHPGSPPYGRAPYSLPAAPAGIGALPRKAPPTPEERARTVVAHFVGKPPKVAEGAFAAAFPTAEAVDFLPTALTTRHAPPHPRTPDLSPTTDPGLTPPPNGDNFASKTPTDLCTVAFFGGSLALACSTRITDLHLILTT